MNPNLELNLKDFIHETKFHENCVNTETTFLFLKFVIFKTSFKN